MSLPRMTGRSTPALVAAAALALLLAAPAATTRPRTPESLLEEPALLAHPILYVVRPQYRPDHHSTETMFQTGEINTGSFVGGGALKVLDPVSRATRTLVSVPQGIARDPEVSWDGRRVIFSLRRDKSDDYHIWELDLARAQAGGPIEVGPRTGDEASCPEPFAPGLRRLTGGAGLSDIDPVYLPDGRILFSSTREPKVCQCNRHIQANLFVMQPDGSLMTQIGRNTLFEGHPAVMPDGRILYERWEYVDKHFGPAFGLWTCNPDGTSHAVFYGNNAWSPGAILDARPVPGTHKVLCTFGSCHDRPWGAIAMVDAARGLDGPAPVVSSWPTDIRGYLTNRREYGDGTGGHPSGGQIDNFVGMPGKREDPYPLNDRLILFSKQVRGETMGIFVADLEGNETLLLMEEPGCYDPMPIMARPAPPMEPARAMPTQAEGLMYVADVYSGDAMAGVPRGTVKTLRVVEAPAKLFWSDANWGIDATQAPALNWNCTSNKRILGDVPVERDGSAYFRVPADRFVYFQLLDAEGMMVQTMRSGAMVRGGERQGCAGCHDNRRGAPAQLAPRLAMRRPASTLKPWYGAPRDFNYLTEVQPVFDRHCVRCHDFGQPAGKKLNLAGDVGNAFNTSYVELRSKSALRWYAEPAGPPRLLVKAVDDGPAEILPPYAWGARRSRLVSALKSGHQGVRLTGEEMDRIITWIDMNAPYYGSYATQFGGNAFGRAPIPPDRMRRLAELTGVRVGDQGAEQAASLVSYTRPEKSPCLDALRVDDPRRAEALEIIRQGAAALAASPRADMPGFKLSGVDCIRQAKWDAHEAAMRLNAVRRAPASH